MIRNSLLVVLTFFVITLTGCATNADSNAMTYISHQSASKSDFKNNITVWNVQGGSQSILSSQITNLSLKKALENSLSVAGFETDYNKAKYLLDAKLIRLDQPLLGGIDITVNCTINYTLTNKNNKIIYNKEIYSTYTAKFSESFNFSERLRLANEGAARENIKKLINDLYDINH